MKKCWLVVWLVLVFALAGCGAAGSKNVEITLPASYLMGQNADDIAAGAKQNGVDEVKKNEDGSLTYIMSKTAYAKMMKDVKEKVTEAVNEIKDGKTFTSIKDITYNKNFSEFTFVVDRKAYESSFDQFAAMGISISGMYYQLMDGTPEKESKVTVKLQDKETKEVFHTIEFPDKEGNLAK